MGMTVQLTPSRSMVWRSAGSPAIANRFIATSADGLEGSVTVPVTDQAGWSDGTGNAISADAQSQMFYYTIQVTYTQNGKTVTPSTGNPAAKKIAIPSGTGPIDLDDLIPLATPGGITISIPDSWSQQLSAAQKAATDAATSAAQAVAGGGGGGGSLTDGSVTNVKVASNAAISLDKTADSTTRLAMLAAERTKLNAVAAGATANASDTALRDRSTHTGTQTADTVVDGTTNKAYTAVEKTKLAGVATAATANSTDAALRDRSTHTGTQTSASISDFTEAVQDAVAALLTSSASVTTTYNDTANTLTLTATGGGSGTTDPELVRDTIGAALIGVGNVAVTVNDAADTITITTSATVNSTDAALRDRSTHTGTQSADTIVDGTTNHAFTAADDTKLAGIATGATANATDALLRDRSTHTGTQSADTVIDGTTNKAYTAAEKTKLAAITGTNTGDQTTITGNAGTATKLATARAINGKSFDGTAAITINATDVPFTPASNIVATNVAAALAEILAKVFPNYGTQPMRFTGYGSSLPTSGQQAGDVYFVAG